MPAHTNKWAVGHVRKGTDTRLTKGDRDGNAAADELAKRGAKLHRVPSWVRKKVETTELVALRAALQLGVTTAAANEQTEEYTDSKGLVCHRKRRDSDGDPKAGALKKQAKAQSAVEQTELTEGAVATTAQAGTGADRTTKASSSNSESSAKHSSRRPATTAGARTKSTTVYSCEEPPPKDC